ncbi:hypothetical protein [Kaarinaea lacus]
MNQTISETLPKQASASRFGVIVFAIGAIVMVSTLFLGYVIEPSLKTQGMKQLEENRDPIMGLVFLFAFGFPLGIVATLAGALSLCEQQKSRVLSVFLLGTLFVALVVIVPGIFGRAIVGVYFGAGGITILIAIIVSFWFWSQYRATLSKTLQRAADLKALGYLSFALAAWNTCGFGGVPSLALYPDKMIELNMLPFAVGQLKSIMAYFVLGWVFTAVGMYKAAMASRDS